MRRSTAIMAMYEPEAQEGENLQFERAKGGYFSVLPDLGLKVVGKTAQETLTGKNLFDINNFEIIRTNYNEKYNIVVDAGVVYGGGVAGAAAGRAIRIPALPGQTVTISGTVVGAALIGEIKESDSVDSNYTPAYNGAITGNVNDRITFTVTPTKEYLGFSWWATDGSAHSCGLIDIQIELGTTATSYEPYCGGIPAPNPDYPMPIQCVKAGTEVRVCGKNLCKPISQRTIVSNWTTAAPMPRVFTGSQLIVGLACSGRVYYSVPYSIDGDVLTVANTGAHIGVAMDIPVEPNTAYQFLAHRVLEGINNCAIAGYDKYGNYVLEIQWISYEDENVSANVFTTPSNVHYVTVTITSSKYDTPLSVTNFQLELGSVPTPYEPYYSGGTIITPCDLYEGDIWWPMTGKVERNNVVIELTGDEVMNQYDNNNYGLFVAWVLSDTPYRKSYDVSLCTHFVNKHSPIWAYGDGVSYSDHPNGTNLYFLPGYPFDAYSLDQFKDWLLEQKANGTPVMVLAKSSTPTLEHYAPQPIHAPSGVVNVLQTPAELPATLSATMLTRRTST